MVLTDNLGAAWRFDNDLTDASGNSRTLAGGLNVTFTTDVSILVQGTHALSGSSLSSVAWGGPAATLASTSLTLSVWLVHPTGVANPNRIKGWSGVLETNTKTGFSVSVGGSTVRGGQAGDKTDDVRAHFAITWDHTTGNWELWKNGALLDSGNQPGQTADIAASSFVVNAGEVVSSSQEPIDMLCAWTRKLTPTEIGIIATPSTADPTTYVEPTPSDPDTPTTSVGINLLKTLQAITRQIPDLQAFVLKPCTGAGTFGPGVNYPSGRIQPRAMVTGLGGTGVPHEGARIQLYQDAETRQRLPVVDDLITDSTGRNWLALAVGTRYDSRVIDCDCVRIKKAS